MQIQISWLLQKPTDLDLHCLQRQGISRFSRTRVNLFSMTRVNIWCTTHKNGCYTVCEQRICTNWSGGLLPAYRINGYCSICRWPENGQNELQRCASSCGPWLFAYGIRVFSHITYHIIYNMQKTTFMMFYNSESTGRYSSVGRMSSLGSRGCLSPQPKI